MGAGTLARNLGISKGRAQCILDQMDARYSVLHSWLERVLTKAAHMVPITATLGWSLIASGQGDDERTFLNFPMQANEGELLRLVFARAGDLPIIGCAHDSFILEDRADQIEQTVWEMQKIMRAASRDLLSGFELRADCKPNEDITLFPHRFIDKREREDGMQHWNWLMQLIEEAEHEGRGRPDNQGRGVESSDEGLRETAEATAEADIGASPT
jgi:hypothetical protein